MTFKETGDKNEGYKGKPTAVVSCGIGTLEIELFLNKKFFLSNEFKLKVWIVLVLRILAFEFSDLVKFTEEKKVLHGKNSFFVQWQMFKKIEIINDFYENKLYFN